MPDVKNMTYSDLTLELPEGRALTLGPRESATISERDFNADDVQKRFREEKIFVLPTTTATTEKKPDSE